DDIPSPANGWLGNNIPRFQSEEYDALVKEMSETAELEKRAELAKRMNDMVIQSGAIIPLIHRGGVSAHANSLTGVVMNEWDSELWNIADWGRAQ
ncbi:MAG: peptide ABC transporter substrate-binding protein, partial [Pseudomonadota bacterium]